MSRHLYSQEMTPDYENFYAKCPYCGFNNIFNRVTDLKTTTPICFKTVTCFNHECAKLFNINNDIANAAYEILLFDAEELYKQKKYSQCILNVAQAYEVLFSYFINMKLASTPVYIEKKTNKLIDTFDELIKLRNEIYKNTKSYTYRPMRNIVFHLIINNIKPNSIAESLSIINNLSQMGKNLKNSEIESIQDEKIKNLISSINNCKVSDLRNNVAHKFAYLPSSTEALSAIEEAYVNIFSFSRRFDLNNPEMFL